MRIVRFAQLHASIFALVTAAGAAVATSPAVRPAWAATPTDSLGVLTFAVARRLALSSSPQLVPPARRVEAARALTLDAGRPPNPAIEGGVENFGGGFGSRRAETTIGLGQLIELGGKRGLRSKSAEAGVGQAQAELRASRIGVVEAADEAFLDAWLAQERLKRLQRAEQIAVEAVTTAGERYSAGAAPVVERTRAEAERIARRIERRTAETDLAVARRTLAAHWGAQDVRYDSLALDPPSAPALRDSATLVIRLASHPEYQLAQSRAVLQNARLREARAARIPDLELRGGVRRFEEDQTSAAVAGVALPLPLWNRQRGAVGSARAEEQAATAELRVVEQRLTTELRNATSELAAAWEGYRDAQDRFLPTATDAMRQLQEGFGSGRFGYLDLLEGRRALLQGELQSIELARDYWRARLRLERLMGDTRELEEGVR